MKSLHHIEQRIFDVDGVRAELSGPVSGYPDYWTNRFNADKTVAEFKSRFAQRYPAVSIVLYDGIGHIAHGNYLIKNLRATYEFDWIKDKVDLYDLYIHEQNEKIESLEQAREQAKEVGEVMREEPDPYQMLGVDRDSSRDEVIQAYRRKILRFHPDKLSGLDEAIIAFGNEQAQKINRARDQILQEREDDHESEAA